MGHMYLGAQQVNRPVGPTREVVPMIVAVDLPLVRGAVQVLIIRTPAQVVNGGEPDMALPVVVVASATGNPSGLGGIGDRFTRMRDPCHERSAGTELPSEFCYSSVICSNWLLHVAAPRRRPTPATTCSVVRTRPPCNWLGGLTK